MEDFLKKKYFKPKFNQDLFSLLGEMGVFLTGFFLHTHNPSCTH